MINVKYERQPLLELTNSKKIFFFHVSFRSSWPCNYRSSYFNFNFQAKHRAFRKTSRQDIYFTKFSLISAVIFRVIKIILYTALTTTTTSGNSIWSTWIKQKPFWNIKLEEFGSCLLHPIELTDFQSSYLFNNSIEASLSVEAIFVNYRSSLEAHEIIQSRVSD